ncbi:MAG: DEAD/DEAH box helicase [Desulfobacterales bacterium]|nr:DEAD/DEAH box helicase [Desulfobacterales bacterium]
MMADKGRELTVEIMYPHDFQLTWESSNGRLGKKQVLLNQELFNRYSRNEKEWLLFLGCSDSHISLSPSLEFFRSLSMCFMEKLRKMPDMEDLRDRADIHYDTQELEALVHAAPLMIGSEYLDLDFMTLMWMNLNKRFNQGIKSYNGTVKDYLGRFSPHIHLAGRVYFHLVESRDPSYPFQFLATYASGVTGTSKHRPLQWALEEYRDESEQMLELLTTVHAAAKTSDLLQELLETGELFHHLAWNAGEAFQFLKQVKNFETCGILCRIPDWWTNKKSTASLKIRLGTKEPSLVGINALIDVEAALFVGDDPISLEEVKALLGQSQGLALIKNRWVEVDTDRLNNLLCAYQAAMNLAGDQGMTLKEALRLKLNPERLSAVEDLADLEISNGEWLEQVICKLKSPELVTRTRPGRGFLATLRPYQQRGLNWLAFLDTLGFGACLADDMGLGKTIQVLAFLSTFIAREPGRTSLLVVPASLLSNWEEEIRRFLPDLKYGMAHPGYEKGTGAKQRIMVQWERFDLVITTYAMVQRHEWMQKVPWRVLILDEAQAIKNPSTRQSKTVKKLLSDTRITMTGTPIENSLSDLWSLFDFINPGLLGSPTEFKAFLKDLKTDPSGYGRLKQVVSPYILRRMKTDRKIAPDLPEKVEMKTFPELSKKQRVLYMDFVHELEHRLEQSAHGIQRKGLVLSALVKFKQICNHPDQYLGTGEFVPKESGKFIRLKEICETIHAKRERVLVFTQFKEMVTPLQAFLETVFHQSGCIIHGSLNIRQRQQAIDLFQGKSYRPFMVLSLKAGGTGLNLTRANHVIHFDRWWNPAVENQATDRAFRIGQKKNVVVHKFITKGTVEEKIDQMLEEKKQLSDKVISPSGESLITEMDNKDLINLFKLSL